VNSNAGSGLRDVSRSDMRMRRALPITFANLAPPSAERAAPVSDPQNSAVGDLRVPGRQPRGVRPGRGTRAAVSASSSRATIRSATNSMPRRSRR
jgi:hypothetical protein